MPFVALVVAAACTGADDHREAFESLVETERDFARTSERHGMKVAFLRYLADDSLLFRPHPVDGKDYTARRPDPDIRLDWKPIRAGVSSAGDLGWSTGPYRVEFPAPDAAPLLGYFVSVWRRQPNGRWKVVVDLGTSNPPDQSCPESSQLAAPEAPVPPLEDAADSGDPAGALLAVDRAHAARAAGDGAARAYDAMLADHARVYRDGHCPARDALDAGELLATAAPTMTWEPREAFVATSGDVGYSYGSYELSASGPSDSPPENGYYVRIWRRTAQEPWKVILDVTSPVPVGADGPDAAEGGDSQG